MAHEFDPVDREKLESEKRKNLYDIDDLILWLGISTGIKVADIGCGTGHFGLPVAEKVGPEGRVFCCDISPEMLDAPTLFFKEVKRILKENGKVGIVEWRYVNSICGPPIKERFP